MPKRIFLMGFLVLLVGALSFVGCVNSQGSQSNELANQGVIQLTPGQAYDFIEENKGNPNFVIIDVRPIEYYNSGYIAGAVNISLDARDNTKFQNKISNLDKNKTYLTYCPDGCGVAANMMKNQGFSYVYDISGGLKQWLEEGLPLVNPAEGTE